ncbi:MAG: zeta toxin family protein [Deltaproteobacteria bacterium]|nr:zeta toxin family protein [Deltaproteobacteria bacterium]
MVEAYQPLGDAKVSEIVRAYYEKRAARTKPQNEPVMVLIGAQPGAGKSRAATMMRAELSMRGGYVHVDADRMREEINTQGARPSSQETQMDAGKLAQALRAQAMTGRRNVLEEGTFRDSRLAAEFIGTVKKAGYRMEMVAVAIPREESLLGIYQRYEYQHQTNVDNPRFVEESYHDAAMGGFERNLAENAGRFARVRIVNRDCQVLFDSARQPGLSAIEALKDAQRLDG